MRKDLLKLAVNIPSVIWIIAKWLSIAWIENFINPTLEAFSKRTGIPMLLIEGILIGAIAIGSLWWLFGRMGRKQVNNAEESHKVYVTQKIVDSKADDLLALSDALQGLRDLDIEVTNKLSVIKRSNSILKNIQSQLRKDWKLRGSETYDSLSEQTIKDVINETITKMKLTPTKVDEKTMMLMIHIAGVLDDNGVGISELREKDERYNQVTALKVKVATQELKNAIRVYMWYSLGINSILLLVSYFPSESVSSLMKTLGKTSTELKAEREQTLSFLLTNVVRLVEEELRGRTK